MAKYKIIPSSRTIVQSPISIGHKAEKGVEAIEFDLTAWVETYGSGTATIIMRRWGDAIPYPIALEIDENNKATWTLSDIDTAKAGMAYAQLNYIVGDEVVKKSDIYTFRVMDSLTGEGDPPEAYESWLEHLTHFAAEAMAEVLDIEGIVTDKTLTVNGGIADAKATGDALALKADKSTTYTKTEVDALIDEVEVETDTTLEIAGAPADAAETGRQFGLLKADLGAQTGLFHWYEKGLIDLSGSSTNLTPETNLGINCAVVECSAGDKFIITGTGGNKSRTWGFIDSNNSILTVSDKNVTVENFEITAPTNAVRLVLNADRNHDIYAYKVGNNLASKIGNGLNNDIKDALLECFKNVAWADDESGKACYKAIQNAIYPDLEKWTWKYTDNDFVKLNGTWTFESAEEGIIRYSAVSPYNKSTRVFVARTGKSRKVENTSPDLYPIPVPTFANKATLSVTPSSAYARFSLLRYDASNNKYVMVRGQAWVQGSFTMNFSAGDNLYVMPYVKAAENGSTAFATEPTEVALTFEEV